ncbi:MAG: DUF61 family protein [Syntrophales bacterium]|nr:DUF61 family protein [Syntrophales bacterium]
MPTDQFPDGFVAGYLKDEFKALNAQIPRKRKSLTELLKEEHPHVVCNDGSAHFFKKKELEYLSQMLYENEQTSLLLPIIIEITSDQGWVTVRSKGETEAKIFSKILDMNVVCKDGLITIFRPQLNIVRKVLKTTTQYVFLFKNP